MISTRWRPRTARLLLAALVLSLVIHFFGYALVELALRVLPKPKTGEVQAAQRAIPEPITIEKVVVRPTPTPTPPPPAAALPSSAVKIGSAPPRHAAASVHAALHATPVVVYHQHSQRSPNRIALAPRTPGQAPTGPPQPSNKLTTDQIAKLETQFSKTIADSRQDVASAVSSVHEPVGGATTRYSAENGNMTIGSGTWRINSSQPLGDGRIAYRLHYAYVTNDGSVEEGDVPWPFVYSRAEDPFARGIKQIAWQCPPPGFVASAPLTSQESFEIDVCLGNRVKP
jgi:hypothetical protein